MAPLGEESGQRGGGWGVGGLAVMGHHDIMFSLRVRKEVLRWWLEVGSPIILPAHWVILESLLLTLLL